MKPWDDILLVVLLCLVAGLYRRVQKLEETVRAAARALKEVDRA